ncbi:zinc ribbon domain-containing protein [Shewanella baltica]|uniref:zinc ribbon domain-containing protein n=1 Tax=Shewanella baltica TaxID=62322 RepID=UPI00216A09EB|nr:zinc ribbon domain-containing protein [Shewanella baltica]
MAIVKCKECGKDVSNSADTCPNCGIKSPGENQQSVIDISERKVTPAFGLAILFIPFIFAWFTLRKGYSTQAKVLAFSWMIFIAYQMFINDKPQPTTNSSSTVSTKSDNTDAECLKTLQCWGEKHAISAGAYCQRPIEKLAKYSFEWLDGAFTPRFSYYRWKDQSQGLVTYIGDKIKLQNGFGAWSNYTYECDFNPATNTVIDVRIGQGTL